MKKLFLLLMTVMTLSLCASAQTRTVHGTVVDAENDEPLIGVSVSAGAGVGVATDVDGHFSLKIPESVTHLKISYVGFKTQEVKVSTGDMLIRLHTESNLLNEVITVAYGKSTRAAFTGSAAVVSSAEIENSQVSNPLNAIKGKVAGVQMANSSGAPGSDDPSINVRGITSLSAGTAPLIILDGTPFSGAMQTLNTNDIESMTVLKDAASAALYGARGANGVILITTKRAKAGDATISLDIKLGSNSRAQQDYDYIKNPAMYYETYYKSLYNYAKDSGMNHASSSAWANNNLFDGEYGLGYNVYTVPNGQTLIGLNGKLNPNATLGRKVSYNGAEYWLQPDKWVDAAYHNSLRQEYNLSISKGTDQNQFYFSLGYLDNDGITPQSGFSRINANLRATTQAKSWLKISAGARYSHYDIESYGDPDNEGESASTANPFAAVVGIAPIYPLYIRDGQGNIMTDSNGITMYDFGGGLNAGLSRPVFGLSNAIATGELDWSKTAGDSFTGDASIDIKLPYNFTFTTNNVVEVFTRTGTAYSNPYYGGQSSVDGSLTKSGYRAVSYTLQQIVNWSHDYGEHSVSALAAHEYYKRTTNSLSGTKQGLFLPDASELGGYINVYSTGSAYSHYNNEGWIFRGLYDYSDRYFANLSYRRDASSKFHPKHRWGSFWSASAAWLISDESFMETTTWIDMLKLKLSYGSQGNDNLPGSYPLYTNTYGIANNNGVASLVPNLMGNENITWETNDNFNAGFEFGVLDNRLSGSVEGFVRKTSDMLFYFPLPPSMGWSGYYANIGDMENKGFEIELHGTVFKNRDFEWNVDANFTWYKNKITKLPEERKTLTLPTGERGYSSGSYFYTEGQSAFTFYLTKYAGVDPEDGQSMWYWEKPIYENPDDPNSKIVDYEHTTTKKYSTATQYLCGSALPPMYGGFGTSLRYKMFDFSINFNYAIGGKTYDYGYASLMGSPVSNERGGNYHADILNSWTPENPNTNIPRFQYGDTYSASSSDRFLVDASYLSLSNIVFGFNVPDNWCHKLYLKSARLYFNADNIWYWTKRQGLDTRQSFTGASSNSMYSPIRTLSGGLSVTF